jgi:hypothetical protein
VKKNPPHAKTVVETKEQRLRHLLDKLLKAVGQVTNHHRFDDSVPRGHLTTLYNRQVEIQRELKGL